MDYKHVRVKLRETKGINVDKKVTLLLLHCTITLTKTVPKVVKT